jgi:quercetin dioxygenase-like cupin family protein
MKLDRIENYKGGWLIGDFDPSLLKNSNVEVAYKFNKKDEYCAPHYHKIGTEINLLISGTLELQNKILNEGDVFIIYPFEVTDPKFLTDCRILAIKTPSIPGDKYLI